MAKFLLKITDFIFQKNCAVCEAPGTNICEGCLSTLPKARLKCLRCGRHNPFGRYCHSCFKPVLPEKVICPLEYRGVARELIHQFKFEDASSLSKEFGKLLAEKIKKFPAVKHFVLTPIPLHRKKLSQRGYNQSELLAKEIAGLLGMKFEIMLSRKPNPVSQVEAGTRVERRKNVKGVFRINPKAKVPEKVIIVDDVITSGATVEEATKVLKKTGVKEVVAIAVAMG